MMLSRDQIQESKTDIPCTPVQGHAVWASIQAEKACPSKLLLCELTRQCNLRCSHCYSESGPWFKHSALSFLDWKQRIEEGADLGCNGVCFAGGEPTLFPRLADLITHASASGYGFIEVFTNGHNLTQQILSSLRESKGSLAFSIYACEDHVHDQITGVRGSRQRTLSAIRRSLAMKIPIRVAKVQIDQKASDTQHLEAELLNLGVADFSCGPVVRAGRGLSLVGAEEGACTYCDRIRYVNYVGATVRCPLMAS